MQNAKCLSVSPPASSREASRAARLRSRRWQASKIKNYKNIEKELPGLQKNVSLAKYTTFKIGGPAKYFFVAKTKKDIIKGIKVAKKFCLPFFILGSGSNVLISDRNYQGLIIKIQNTKCPLFTQSKIQKTKIYIQAGVLLSLLANLAAKGNLTGLEWAVGIPGTIGGAIRGNAGAFGGEMRNIISKVEAFDTKNGEIKIFKNKDCQFNYRDSIFKKNKNLIILSAIIQLRKGAKKEIQNKIKKYLNCRKETQPLDLPSAGSIFKNPSGFSAAELIEECGLKGKRVGQAQISEKHANFIVNLGQGKTRDVKKLINLAKQKVKNQFGIKLEEEIQFLGF